MQTLPADAAFSPHAPYPGARWAVAFTLLGLALSVWMALHSNGVYHDDDLTHLQIARWVWKYPRYLLDDWGRPGFTLLYAPAAKIGWLAARVFSGILTALTAWLAYRIAVRQGIRLAASVPLLFWLQPLTFTLSYTTLTETPLALYFTLATWLFVRGNYGWSAATISLAAVTRHEAAVFLVIWLAALIRQRRPVREWVWLAWAPLLCHVLSGLLLHKLPLGQFFAAQATNEYGSGTWLTMLTRWAVAAGIGPLLLAWVGLSSVFRRPGGALWIGAALAYFLAHTVIYRFGLFASGGYERFLVPLGPVVAVAGAQALSQAWLGRQLATAAGGDEGGSRPGRLVWMALGGMLLLWVSAEVEFAYFRAEVAQHNAEWTRWPLRGLVAALSLTCVLGLALSLSRRRSLRAASAAVFPAVMLALAFAQPLIAAQIPPPLRHCAPLVLTERLRAYRHAVGWLRTSGLAERRWVAASPWFDELLGRCRPPRYPSAREQVVTMRPGDVLLWDCRECASPRHGLSLGDLRRREDFNELWHSGGDLDDDVYCAVFERRAPPGAEPATAGAH